MRRLTVCVLVLGLSACGGGGGGSKSSGVAGSKPLTDINDAELEQLCDWSGKSSVSYKPTEAQFCTVLAVQNSSELEECLDFAQQCEDSEGDLEFSCGVDRDDLDGCEATVSDYENCVRAASAAQREYYQNASCSDVGSTDSAPSLSACDALFTKCPWLGGDGDNPNADDDFDDDDDFGDDEFGDGGFVCDDGEDIDDSWFCDGTSDCSAGEDEDGCSSEPTFTCDDGGTTDLSYVCDGVADCSDISDEASCDGGFVCADGVDVYDSAKCDGYDDCVSGDDEFDCPDSVDPVDPVDPAPFTCLNGGQIPSDWVCDGEIDCADSSDESNCP